MSLETRVETLEHEFKILKNEIESMLLEIQNQVLIHYYPTLRSEDHVPPKDALPLLDAQSAAARKEPQAKENVGARSGNDVIIVPPRTKEVSLHELRGKAKQPLTSLKTAPAIAKADFTPTGAATDPADTLAQAALPHLAKWVNDSVEKIGKELTQNLVESSVDADYTVPEVTDYLIELIDLCEEEEPPPLTGTKELMDVLLKLNKMLDQVAKMMGTGVAIREEANGQGDHNHLHDHR